MYYQGMYAWTTTKTIRFSCCVFFLPKYPNNMCPNIVLNPPPFNYLVCFDSTVCSVSPSLYFTLYCGSGKKNGFESCLFTLLD